MNQKYKKIKFSPSKKWQKEDSDQSEDLEVEDDLEEGALEDLSSLLKELLDAIRKLSMQLSTAAPPR